MDLPEKALKLFILAEEEIIPVKTFTIDRDIWRLLVIALRSAAAERSFNEMLWFLMCQDPTPPPPKAA